MYNTHMGGARVRCSVWRLYVGPVVCANATRCSSVSEAQNAPAGKKCACMRTVCDMECMRTGFSVYRPCKRCCTGCVFVGPRASKCIVACGSRTVGTDVRRGLKTGKGAVRAAVSYK